MRIAIAIGLAAALTLAACVPPSASGGRLLVERTMDGESDIYIMNADGSGLTALTSDPAWDGTASWSPDGTRIAFASEREGDPAIYIMDADGSNVKRLTSLDSAAMMPAWSPDGKQIAFASNRNYEVVMQGGRQQVEAGLELWMINVDGTNLRRLTGNHTDQALYPAWSPDGSRLAYMEIADAVRIVSQEPRLNAPASVISDGLAGRHWTPAWAPDGETIALQAEIDGVRDIWLIRPGGGEAVNLTNLATADGDPAWSPDGTQIAFISDRDGPVSVYVMNADGTNVRRLTNDEADYARPKWIGN